MTSVSRRRPAQRHWLRSLVASSLLASGCQGCGSCFDFKGCDLNFNACASDAECGAGETCQNGLFGTFCAAPDSSFGTGVSTGAGAAGPQFTTSSSSPGVQLQIGPPDIAYADRPPGVPIHVLRTAGYVGPVSITIDAPPMTVTTAPLVLGDATSQGGSEGTLMLAAVPGSVKGVVQVAVNANAGMSVASVPLAVVIPGAPGSLDKSFAASGYVRYPPDPMGSAKANAVAVASGGNIFVAGDDGAVPAKRSTVLVYSPDGLVLGGTPLALPWPGADNSALSIAVDAPDGILLAGFAPKAGAPAGTLYRCVFTPNGSLDPTFGTGGDVQYVPFGHASATYRAIVALANHDPVAVGDDTDASANTEGVITRFLANGAAPVDTLLPLAATHANGVFYDADGKHVVVIGDTNANGGGMYVTRFDPTAGTFGFATGTQPYALWAHAGSAFENGNALAPHLDGAGNEGYLAAGAWGGAAGPSSSAMSLVAFDGSGALDSTFGGGTGFVTPLPSPSTALGAVADSSNRTVVVGASGAPSNVAVLRVAADGTTDSTAFDTSPFSGGSANAVALDRYGRIIVVGYDTTLGVPHAFVARYWP